jgi:hypothetical protein
MNAPLSPLAKLSPWLVRAAALWILGVSAIKTFLGSPNDIPSFLRNSFLGPDVAFLGSISVEFAFALVALVSPRVGWLLVSALMSVFVAVLVHLISIGATSCGCFGGAIKLSPIAMLAIDGSLFALMLASRPWSSIPAATVPKLALAVLFAGGAAAPWLLVTNEEVVLKPPEPVVHKVDAPMDAAQPATSEPKAAGLPKPNSADGNLAPHRDASGQWTLPAKLPRWARLRPPDWVGKSVHETDLAIWMDTRAYAEDATWILYLETCTHCRDYLQKLESEFATDPKVYVFVRLATPNDEAEGVVKIKPPGETAALPAEVSWVVGPKLPPWELVLEGSVVKQALEHGE